MTANETCGAPFFLQIPSVDAWSHMSVQFQPIGIFIGFNIQWIYFTRIYTTRYGIDRIKLNYDNISAQLYQRIADSDFYYYEMQVQYSDTYRVSTVDPNVMFSVDENLCL